MKKTKTLLFFLSMMVTMVVTAQDKIVRTVSYSIGDGESFATVLKNTLGNSLYKVDSLNVVCSGRIPSDWADALRDCCKNGRLTGINMSRCEYIKEIPAGAFMSQIVNSAPAKSSEESGTYLMGLRYITLPPYLEKIGAGAFCCTDLRSVEIPYWVTEVCSGAFAGCVNLTDVVLRGDRFYADDMAEFAGLPACAVLHVAPGCGDNYRGNDAWSAFGEVREDDTAFKVLDLSLDGSQSLAEVLGADNMLVDSLRISGVLRDKDYETLRDNSNYGRLYSIDLSDYDATASDGVALFGCKFNTIVMPRTLPEIYSDFLSDSYVTNLVLPDRYDKIGIYAFNGFSGVVTDSTFAVAEGCRKIEFRAFVHSSGVKTLILPSTLDVLEPEALCFNWVREWDDRPIDIYVNRMYPPSYVSEVGGEYKDNYERTGPFGCPQSHKGDENRCLTRTWRLFVPMGAKKNYESAEHWNHFRTIIETPLLTGVSDGIDAVMSGRGETSASDGVYSLDGRMVAKDGSGVTARGVYIVKENGRARKVVMGR